MPPRPPVVVALMGLPGAGKTTVATALRERAPGMARVSRDDLIAAAPARPYGEDVKRALFRDALAAAAAELRAGRDVVLEGMPFSRADERAAVARAARDAGAHAVFAFLDVPPAEARRRIGAASAHAAPDREPALVDAVAARFDAPGPDVLRLDATRPAEELATRVLDAVAAARGR